VRNHSSPTLAECGRRSSGLRLPLYKVKLEITRFGPYAP